MQQVINNIQQSVQKHPRPLYIVYVNPVFSDLFLSNNFSIFYELRSKNYPEAIIFFT